MYSYSTPQKTIQEKRETSDRVVLTPEELNRCKDYIVQMKQRKICAFYSNPRTTNVSMMLNLTKDMQSIMSLLSPFDYFISPFTTIDILKTTIQRHTPEIVCYYGHAERNVIYLEDNTGRPEAVAFEHIIDALKLSGERLKCVALFACLTETLASKISEAFPNVYVIFWSTKTLDKGAQVFARGFLNYVAKFESVDEFEYAFWHGYTEFESGFEVGDPEVKYREWITEVNMAKIERRSVDYSKKPSDGIPGLIKNSKTITYEEINDMRSARDMIRLSEEREKDAEQVVLPSNDVSNDENTPPVLVNARPKKIIPMKSLG